jgi:hypothetical protein
VYKKVCVYEKVYVNGKVCVNKVYVNQSVCVCVLVKKCVFGKVCLCVYEKVCLCECVGMYMSVYKWVGVFECVCEFV